MGGSGHSVTQTSASFPTWMEQAGYPQQFINAYQNLVMPGGQLAGMPANLNQQVAGFNPTQTEAMQGILGTAQGQAPVTGASEQNLVDTLSGKYLDPNSNPYLRGTYDQAAQAMSDQYKYATAPSMAATAVGGGGSTGGTAYGNEATMGQYGLGQNLSNLANQVYGGAYNQERGNQMQAIGLEPGQVQSAFMPGQQALGIGSLQQQQQQTQLDTAFQNAMRQWNLPYTELDAYGNALSTARGPAGTSTVTVPNRAGPLK